MPEITRTITNVGDPLLDAAGNIRADAKVTFKLLKATFDIDGEFIDNAAVTATTDASGEFSIDLWPTDRSMEPDNAYLCQIDNGRSFQKPLPTGATIQWKDFCEA